MDTTPTNSLIDDFEASFMNCTCAFTKQESSIDVDKGEKGKNISEFAIF